MIENGEDSHEEIRYVMIDDQMVGGKFGAITTWTGPDYDYYTTPEDLSPNEPVEGDEIPDSSPVCRTTRRPPHSCTSATRPAWNTTGWFTRTTTG